MKQNKETEINLYTKSTSFEPCSCVNMLDAPTIISNRWMFVLHTATRFQICRISTHFATHSSEFSTNCKRDHLNKPLPLDPATKKNSIAIRLSRPPYMQCMCVYA